MKNFLLALLLTFAFVISTSTAQAQEDSKFSMDVTLNSDIFFGFYPFFAGSYAVSDNTDFTFYGILWSGGTGGFAQGWGNWTEFGIGVNFQVSESININPQIGLLSGSLTSGGSPSGQTVVPVLGEGFVPNLTIGLDNDQLEGEFYLGYYMGIDHGQNSTSNFLHYWANIGYKFTPFFSAGLHYEQLNFSGGKNVPDGSGFSFFQSVGPYVQFADPKGGAFARFTTGGDIRGETDTAIFRQPSFFKLTVGYSF
ncbi:MAG: hypothetical protein JJU28_07395 [Cyclobacteriaceae bacterium]|nr:hypothetical protein [Cyclobacteriaceae bacterium]